MTLDILSSAIWLDFKIAVLTTVMIPLGLWVWAFMVQFQPLTQLLLFYWRVSSLLAITVYLMIAGFPISFITGALARVLIPISLWFWDRLNAQIEIQDSWIQQCFQVWRWIITVYMGVGFLFSAAFVPCAFQAPVPSTCQVWFQPPLAFREIFHRGVPIEVLGLVGLIGLGAYGLGTAYFFWLWDRGDLSDLKS